MARASDNGRGTTRTSRPGSRTSTRKPPKPTGYFQNAANAMNAAINAAASTADNAVANAQNAVAAALGYKTNKSTPNARQLAAASKLKQTVKGGGGDYTPPPGGFGVLGPGVDVDIAQAGGYQQSWAEAMLRGPRQGHSVQQALNGGMPNTPGTTPIQQAAQYVLRPDNTSAEEAQFYLAQVLAGHSEVEIGTQNGDAGALMAEMQANGTLSQYYVDAAALHINEALGNVPVQVNETVMGLYNTITGKSHVGSQTRVGGTKGGTVDRSEAVKKAWLTRKKNYGSSGRKDS